MNQLTDIYDTFRRSLDNGMEVRAISVISAKVGKKSLNRVWHKGLLIKLESVGISGNL